MEKNNQVATYVRFQGDWFKRQLDTLSRQDVVVGEAVAKVV
jgi:hypothetical protein